MRCVDEDCLDFSNSHNHSYELKFKSDVYLLAWKLEGMVAKQLRDSIVLGLGILEAVRGIGRDWRIEIKHGEMVDRRQ
jgi:hypothetical protein